MGQGAPQARDDRPYMNQRTYLTGDDSEFTEDERRRRDDARNLALEQTGRGIAFGMAGFEALAKIDEGLQNMQHTYEGLERKATNPNRVQNKWASGIAMIDHLGTQQLQAAKEQFGFTDDDQQVIQIKKSAENARAAFYKSLLASSTADLEKFIDSGAYDDVSSNMSSFMKKRAGLDRAYSDSRGAYLQ